MSKRVSICVITQPVGATHSAKLRADAIVLIFVGGPRNISGEQALAILHSPPTLITTVALLFLDENANGTFIDALKQLEDGFGLHSVHFRIRQLYGLTPQFIAHQTAR